MEAFARPARFGVGRSSSSAGTGQSDDEVLGEPRALSGPRYARRRTTGCWSEGETPGASDASTDPVPPG